MAHDEFGAAFVIGPEVECDLALNHLLFALSDPAHIDPHAFGERSVHVGIAHQVSSPGAPEFILGWHTGDSRTRAANPLTLDHSDLPAAAAEMPGKEFSALAA